MQKQGTAEDSAQNITVLFGSFPDSVTLELNRHQLLQALRGEVPLYYITLDSKELNWNDRLVGLEHTMQLSGPPPTEGIVRAQVDYFDHWTSVPFYDKNVNRTADNWDQPQDVLLSMDSPPIGGSAVYRFAYVVEQQPANWNKGVIPITRLGFRQMIEVTVINTKLVFDAPDETATYTIDLDESLSASIDLPRVTYEGANGLRYSLSGDLPGGFAFYPEQMVIRGTVRNVLGKASWPLTLNAEDASGDQASKSIELSFVNPWHFLYDDATVSGAVVKELPPNGETLFIMTRGAYGEIRLPRARDLITGNRGVVPSSKVRDAAAHPFNGSPWKPAGLTLVEEDYRLVIKGTPSVKESGTFTIFFSNQGESEEFPFRIRIDEPDQTD